MTPDQPENHVHLEEKDKSVTCPSCRETFSVIAKSCPICGNELWETKCNK